MILEYTASPNDAGVPLGLVLRRSMAVSDTLIRKTKREKRRLELNGKPAYTNEIVSAGQKILIDLPDYPALNTSVLPDEPDQVSLLYSDPYLLAAWKPAFLQTHPSPSAPAGSDTLENRVQKLLKIPAHPVHRLDRETSGIILLACSPYIQSVLQNEMQDGRFRKEYHAVVFGIPPDPSGTIEAPILQESPENFTRIIHPNGQPAKSYYEKVASFRISSQPVSLLRLIPFTGRTHQLRVHLSSLGFPILGDFRYGTNESVSFSNAIGLTRQQLCSDKITFEHPVFKNQIVVSGKNDLEIMEYEKEPILA